MNVLPSSLKLKFPFHKCARSGPVNYNILARWPSSTSQSLPPYFGLKSHWQRPIRSSKVRQPTAYISILGPKFERKTISGARREGTLKVSEVGIFSAHWAAYCSLRKGNVVTRRNRNGPWPKLLNCKYHQFRQVMRCISCPWFVRDGLWGEYGMFFPVRDKLGHRVVFVRFRDIQLSWREYCRQLSPLIILRQ